MKPTVAAVRPPRSLTWLGRVGLPGVLDGRHTHRGAHSAGQPAGVQHERLSGLLTPLLRTMLTSQTPEAFRANNDALAARVLA